MTRYNLAYKGFLIGTTQEEGHTLPTTVTQQPISSAN
jgi:hypothetical protein